MVSNYDILGVSPTASKADIKKAYHKLSLIYHPDRPSGNLDKFLKIKNAYDALTVDSTHKIHDQHVERNSYIHILKHIYNHETKCLEIYLEFSRDIVFIKTKRFGTKWDCWTVRGLNGGWIELNEDYLIASKFEFDLYFTTNYGKTYTKSFKFNDPRLKPNLTRNQILFLLLVGIIMSSIIITLIKHLIF